MSELNRLLSEISTLQQPNQQLMLANIAKPKSLMIVKFSLLAFFSLLGLSGISWALSSTEFKPALELPQINPSIALASSPTQKVIIHPIRFANNETLAHANNQIINDVAPAISATQKPIAKPQLLADIQIKHQRQLIERKKTEPRIKKVISTQEKPAQFDIEAVVLSGQELAEIAYDRAKKYTADGKMNEAIEQLYQAMKYNPKHIAAIKQLAASLFGKNKITDAERVLKQGIIQQPNSASLRMMLAKIYQQTQRDSQALDVLQFSAKQLDTEQVRYVAMRAMLAQKLNNRAIAKSSFQWLTTMQPSNGRWWLGFAIACEQDNQFASAQQAYQKALQGSGLSVNSQHFVKQRLAAIKQQKTR